MFKMSTSDNQSWIQSVCSSLAWRWPKCECLLVILTWFTGLLGACFRAVCRLGRVSSPILPTVNPRSQSPKRRCARWWNWCRKSKCQCTSPTCRRYRRWKKDWRKFPARCFRRMRNLKWPVWEPDQNSLFTRVIKASRLDGFKMSLKEGMHFAARIMYVVTYKIFTGVAIYLIFVSSVKIRTHPLIFKDVGKIALENTPFGGIDVCPSHLYPQALLQEADRLFDEAKNNGSAVDKFGNKWSLEQATKLYYYVYYSCQAAKTHSRFNGASNADEYLTKRTPFKYHNNFTLKDHLEDQDFQNILKLVNMFQGTVDCSKILKACRWGPDGTRNCSELFEVEKTETGSCCRFKRIPESSLRSSHKSQELTGSKWNIDHHWFTGKTANDEEKEIREALSFQKVAGQDFGLSFVLVMDTKDVACPTNEANAYTVYVHSPLNSPNAKTNGIPIAPGHEVNINVNADITIADPDILDLNVDSRQCYSQEEGLNFLNSTYYTEENCRMECRNLLFQSKCKCHRLGTTSGQNETLCGPQDETCVTDLEAEIQANGYSQMCMNLSTPMKCYHGCTEVVYTTMVSSVPYSGEPGIAEQLDLKEGQKISTVRIFFGSDNFAAKEIQKQYDFWEYVGIVGGLLGMLIGFDFMTLVHLVYAFGIWMKGLWFKKKKSRVARAIFNMTNHVDLVKALSNQTPSIPIIPTTSPGSSTGILLQPQTWPGEMNKLDARLQSIFVIRKGAENNPSPSEDLTDLHEPGDLIEPVEIVIPTRQKIQNALFEHMPKKIAFKNIFTIPTRVTPACLIDGMELLDIEPAEPSDMELVDPLVVQPVAQADLTEILPLEANEIIEFVEQTDIGPVDPDNMETVNLTSLEPNESATTELIEPEPIEPSDTATTEQTQIEPIDPEPVALVDSVELLEPTDTNPVDPAKSRNRIPLYKHTEYLENGQVVIVLTPKKSSSCPEENISNSKDEL